jgi:hypothetical protein
MITQSEDTGLQLKVALDIAKSKERKDMKKEINQLFKRIIKNVKCLTTLLILGFGVV